MTFDEPERIIEIIQKYPDFKEMYDEIFWICQNTERVMEMFSKELLEMDRNTVQYMIEEQQAELDQRAKQLNQKEEQLNQKDEQLNQKDDEIAKLKKELAKLKQV
ncbi:MAG: hypothetical protein PHG16_12490 [Lachnospiraceae bacterium]|nr:hypothetical protein [Lachnospiraceae bacterium]